MFLTLATTVLVLSLTPLPVASVSVHKDMLDLPLQEKVATVESIQEVTSPPVLKTMELAQKRVEQGAKSVDLERWYNQYSHEYGVDKNLLVKIAQCESGQNPESVSGDYGGMFQYASQTWSSTRAEMGLDYSPDLRFNAEESIKTTAFKISRGGMGAWPNCAA